jgi:DNA-binding MarR family transcriptional regulator
MPTTSRTTASDRELVTQIMAGFRAAFRELRCAGSERMLRAGVSMANLHLMTLIERHGEMAMSRIAELQDVSLSNASGLIDRIEERGFVERVRVPDDRRVVHVRLTDEGARKLREVELFKEDMMQRVLSKLDDQALVGVAQAMDDLRNAVGELVHDDPSFQFHEHDHGHHGADQPRA